MTEAVEGSVGSTWISTTFPVYVTCTFEYNSNYHRPVWQTTWRDGSRNTVPTILYLTRFDYWSFGSAHSSDNCDCVQTWLVFTSSKDAWCIHDQAWLNQLRSDIITEFAETLSCKSEAELQSLHTQTSLTYTDFDISDTPSQTELVYTDLGRHWNPSVKTTQSQTEKIV